MGVVTSLDTTDAARRVQLDVIRRMTPDERVGAAVRMSEDARSIAVSGIRSRHPEWSEERVRRELLVRIYGEDLVERAWPRPRDA